MCVKLVGSSELGAEMQMGCCREPWQVGEILPKKGLSSIKGSEYWGGVNELRAAGCGVAGIAVVLGKAC